MYLDVTSGVRILLGSNFIAARVLVYGVLFIIDVLVR